MELGPDTYFPEYAKLFIIPVDVLAFPFKGNRKIEAKVIYGTHELEIALCGVEDVKTVIGAATSLIMEHCCYKEFEKMQLI